MSEGAFGGVYMNRRFLFFLFGVLDLNLVIRFGFKELGHAGELSSPSFIAHSLVIVSLPFLLSLARLLFFASLVASAVGLFRGRNWGLVVSYAQFPFRFLFMLLSFGFISEIAGLLHMADLYLPLIYAAMMLEIGRLVCSVWMYRAPDRGIDSPPGG
jgi:hypothetical protein